jgi:hypothetical protein
MIKQGTEPHMSANVWMEQKLNLMENVNAWEKIVVKKV